VTRVRDPIHNYIHLDELGEQLIDTPRVQRLRRIHQLGTGNLVYPGANHTRFEHSLGAYHLAGEAARALGLVDGDRRALQAAALLHDVGHGPFSHTCDPLYRDFLHKSHEDVSVEALQRGPIADALARHNVEPARVAALVRGERPLGQLVSGDLDVDRMDYLVRDSHYTGVHIGVDLARLVHDLALTPRGLAVKQGSLPAAEMLLVTRVQMYATVYFHRTLRIAERLIERAMRLALEAGEITPDQLPNSDDAGATAALRHSKTDARRLVSLVDQRKLYKAALEADLAQFRVEAVEALARDGERQREIEREIAKDAKLTANDVILDVPKPPSIPEIGTLVLYDDGATRPLAEASALTRSLGLAQRDHWRLRVIVPPTKREDAGEAARRVLARELS
jgi:HD superfamily phosphohydrolase